MKTKFMYVPLVISIICMSLIHTSEEYVNAEINSLVMIKYDSVDAMQQAKGSMNSIETVQQQLALQKTRKHFCPPLSPEELVAQAGSTGKHTVTAHKKNDNTILFGKIILDTEQKKQSNGALPDEQGGHFEKIMSSKFKSSPLSSNKRSRGSGGTKIATDNILNTCLNSADTRVAIHYKNSGGRIVNLENGKTLFKTKNVSRGTISQAKIFLEYRGYKQELIPLSYFNVTQAP